MLKNIAVLIDADNISSQKIDWVFKKINQLGVITVKRIYGDFTKSQLLSWENHILKYAIEKKHQTAYTAGKNSSDIALTIDAMDLLYSNQYDGFCIVSSDSDFIGLAMRIRRSNIQVFGFGENKTIKEFRQVCSTFFEIPVNNQTQTQNNQPTVHQTKVINKYTASQLKCDSRLLAAICDSIINNKINHDGWANFSKFNSYMNHHYKNLSATNYGYKTWKSLIDELDIFELQLLEKILFIREKSDITQYKPQNLVNNKEKITNKKLIEDILNIINANTARTNEWIHIGYLGSQLKLKGYNPKDYGFKSFTALLENTNGIMMKKFESTIYFTLSDQSNIHPVQLIKSEKYIQQKQEESTSIHQNFEETNFYKLLIHNQIQIENKIKGFLKHNIQLKFYDIWHMLHNSLPSHIVLSEQESIGCFMYFFKKDLTLFTLKSENDILYIKYKVS